MARLTLDRHTRPPWTTGSLIPLSFLCGIGAGVLIWQGGKRTKKTTAVQKKLRKALGVDEPVSAAVKKPRRATVSGEPPQVVSVSAGVGAPTAMGARPPKRASTIDGGAALPVLPEGEYQLDREAILGPVDEGMEEPEPYVPGNAVGKGGEVDVGRSGRRISQ